MVAVTLETDAPPMTREDVEFYMVWTKQGRAPRKTHDTRDRAAAEAQRLAGANPGRKFIVLRAVDKFHAPAAEVAS